MSHVQHADRPVNVVEPTDMLECGKGGFSLDLEGFWEPVLPSLQFCLCLSDERVCLSDEPGHLVDGTGLVEVVADNIRRDLGQLHVRPQTRGWGQAAVLCQCMCAWERGEEEGGGAYKHSCGFGIVMELASSG